MAASETQWFSGPLEREGQAQYVHLIRGPGDPPRGGADRSEGRGWNAMDRRSGINKLPPAHHAQRLRQHLGDGVARTFNRIAVELYDVTADVAFGTHADVAVWDLVSATELEHTGAAPIRFRLRGEYTSPTGVLGLPVNPRLPRWGLPGATDPRCDQCHEHEVPGHDERVCPHSGCQWSAQVCEVCGGFERARAVLETHLRECAFAWTLPDLRWNDVEGRFTDTAQLALFG